MKTKKFSRVVWSKLLPTPVIGVDEAGRGCLAGPVVAGAVILSRVVRGVFFDSKILSEARREELFNVIQNEHRWAVGIASVDEIAQLNILHAALLAMRRAVEGLGAIEEGHVLIDGPFALPGLVHLRQTPLIKGDTRVAPISAASIIAKVSRDRLMKEMAQEFPVYGFEVHKGYGTELHQRALAKHGPCVHHRMSFKGVGELKAPLEHDL